jgi:hypothetical protein
MKGFAACLRCGARTRSDATRGSGVVGRLLMSPFGFQTGKAQMTVLTGSTPLRSAGASALISNAIRIDTSRPQRANDSRPSLAGLRPLARALGRIRPPSAGPPSAPVPSATSRRTPQASRSPPLAHGDAPALNPNNADVLATIGGGMLPWLGRPEEGAELVKRAVRGSDSKIHCPPGVPSARRSPCRKADRRTMDPSGAFIGIGAARERVGNEPSAFRSPLGVSCVAIAALCSCPLRLDRGEDAAWLITPTIDGRVWE